MQYYLMSNETDEKIIGKKYPQCKGMPSKMGLTYKWFEQPNSMTKLTNDDFPNFQPELIFELEEKAILTDVVSPSNISAKGFLLNQKVKDILEHFSLMEHKYYPATLIVRNNKLKYYWLHFVELADKYLHYVDFGKSSFYLGNLARWKEENLEIKSLEEYLKLKEKIGFKTITFEVLHFNEQFKTEVNDLFYIASLHNDFLVSDKLKNTLQAQSVTGLKVYQPSFSIF